MPDKRKKEPRNGLGTDDCLFDKEGLINKREFLKRLGKIGGLTLTSFAFVGIPGRAPGDPPAKCTQDPANDDCEKKEKTTDDYDLCQEAVYTKETKTEEVGDVCKYGTYTKGSKGFIEEYGDHCGSPYTGPLNSRGSLGPCFNAGDDCRVYFFEKIGQITEGGSDICVSPFGEHKGGDVCLGLGDSDTTS